jgi:hypothetical protein
VSGGDPKEHTSMRYATELLMLLGAELRIA